MCLNVEIFVHFISFVMDLSQQKEVSFRHPVITEHVLFHECFQLKMLLSSLRRGFITTNGWKYKLIISLLFHDLMRTGFP